MIPDVIMLILSLAFILISCIFFTNSVEWLGKKLNLNQGVVGSILAAVGTALPETIIPIIAIIFYSGKEASQIATGAILGAPFMLSTLGFLMTGAAVILYSSANKRSIKMNADPNVFRRDLEYFILIYTLAIFTSVFNQFNEVRLASVVLLLTLYLLYVRATFNSEGKIEQNVEELLFSRIFSLPPTLFWIIIQLFISLSGIIFSSHLFVGYVKDLSHLMGVSPLILSLVITPIATELPEKFNSIVWVGQKKDTLALGNITGAMVFQSSIPVIIGILLTPWNITGIAFLSATLALTSATLNLIWINMKKSVNPFILMSGGILYGIFLLTVIH
ncbi:sodium:calcium antiporter [Caldanaerobacter subterraneus]|uniref:Membrane protein n=2 Tax=Caldanaerobacter subterraneus TaxID=911092 RepID=U5CRH6_CALSX|nr:membrane protein [Caldanaerobacter subterraneus]ERM92573.1 membrane protein [Caldanaerobacter subterraneus subsp. yonseiensis KB-1]MBE3578628.1 sodium:calcium antiporter [Caldanaerobacter subterraneus]NNG67112.1 sodium:calcium antiporter [Caldanaerobacter subterraneus]